jgi:hypothetical protein
VQRFLHIACQPKKKDMRIILFSGLFLLLIIFNSCDKTIEGKEYQFPFIELNHCADTTINGQTVQICFDSLISDSRCPANAECIWQGESTVKLSLHIAGVQQSFKLSTFNNPPTFRNDTTISGYKIKLLSVSPYPGLNQQSPYTVELSVSK